MATSSSGVAAAAGAGAGAGRGRARVLKGARLRARRTRQLTMVGFSSKGARGPRLGQFVKERWGEGEKKKIKIMRLRSSAELSF
jgi:hypothetical protein